MLVILIVLLWLGCGIHEVLADHLWWEELFVQAGEKGPVINWRDRQTIMTILMGGISLFVGVCYRHIQDRHFR